MTWQRNVTEVKVDELNQAIEKYRELDKKHEDAKAISTALSKEKEEAQNAVVAILKAAGMTKYHLEGLGTYSIRNRFVVRTPKTIEEKNALFQWIKSTKGGDVLMGMTSINHLTLNSFVNAEKDIDPLVIIPGLEAPTLEQGLTFRGDKAVKK